MKLSNAEILLKAAEFLADENLVWSSDFEAVRLPLSAMLRAEASNNFTSPFARQIAEKVLADA